MLFFFCVKQIKAFKKTAAKQCFRKAAFHIHTYAHAQRMTWQRLQSEGASGRMEIFEDVIL